MKRKLFIYVSLALMLFVLVPLVRADYWEPALGTPSGWIQDSSDSTNYAGEIIHVGAVPIRLYNVTIHPLSTGNTVYVYLDGGATGTLLNSSSVAANKNASFNMQLNANTNYLIVQGSGGSAYNIVRNATSQNYPVNWTNNAANAWNNATQIDKNTLAISRFSTWQDIVAIQTNDTLPSGLVVTLNSPANNTGFFATSQVFNASLTPTGTNIVNASIFVWFSNGTLFNQTRNLITGSTTNSTVWNITGFIIGNYKWNVLGCITNSSCYFAPNNQTFSYDGITNSNMYNATTLPGAVESFVTNVTVPSNLGLSTATFYWNNTAYIGSIASDGVNSILSNTLTIPNVTGAKSWFWSLTFNNGINFNLSSLTQTVGGIQIDSCGTFTQRIFNYSLYDEDARTALNGTVELLLNVYAPRSTTLLTSFNASYSLLNSQAAGVCVNLTNATYSVDYQAKYYGNSSYEVEYKFAQSVIITNTTATQQVPLYDLLDSRDTTFSIILQNPDLSTINGAVVDVQRQYPALNQYISVESPLTDSIGTTAAHLVAAEVYYNFVVSKNGTILGTFNHQLVQCQNPITLDCRVNLNLVQSTGTFTDFTNYGNISIDFTWQQSIRTLGVTFLSTDGLSHTVSWNVTKLDQWGNTTICNNQATGTGGSFSCFVPLSYGNGSVLVNMHSDNINLGYNTFNLGSASSSVFGGTGVVLALLMYSTISLLLIAHPVTLVIGSLLGLIFASAFHLVDGGSFIGNASIILWFIIAGGILIYWMRNRV